MKKKILYFLLILSLFINVIFIANIFTDKSYDKNIIGYYSYDNSLNFNFERDGVLYVDNGRNMWKRLMKRYIGTSIPLILTGKKCYLLLTTRPMFFIFPRIIRL